jgi:hypothetical protein
LFIANGKHQSTAKSIVVSAFAFFANDESCLFDVREFIPFALCPVHCVIPSVWRVAEPKQLYCLVGHAALCQIIAGDLSGRIIGQELMPSLSDLFVNLDQRFLEMTRFLVMRVSIVFERNTGAIRQPPQDFRKTDVLVFLNKGEDITALVTAEAMEDLFVRTDVKTGSLFLVKRAEGNEVGPCVL